jgi:hypothetical protein
MMNRFTNNRLLLSALFFTIHIAGVLAQKPAAPPAKTPAKPPATTAKPAATPRQNTSETGRCPGKKCRARAARDSNVLKLFDKNTVKWQKTYKGRFETAQPWSKSRWAGRQRQHAGVSSFTRKVIPASGWKEEMDASGFKLEERHAITSG